VRSAGLPRSDFERECRPWVCVPRPIDPSQIAAAIGEWSLAPRERIVLDILGRHLFLADGALADVLGRTVGWARAQRAELVRRGLARVVDPDELRIPL
jgi:hypothetical protein